MNVLNDAYNKCVADNERNIRFWEDVFNNLSSLDFTIFNEKLSVPTLVPIGTKIFFRGELKHTNELTIALNAEYFVKCSVKQAEIIRQHRMKEAHCNLTTLRKEKEYLENQILFRNQNVNKNTGEEIVELVTEEEDNAWRLKHRENVRKHKQQKKKPDEQKEKTDDELWYRLEELELQEELQNELAEMNANTANIRNNLIAKEPDILQKKSNQTKTEHPDVTNVTKVEQTPRLDLLQQVIDRQNELEQKLLELKNIERGETKSEQELISRLDEMEQLDELEDEMDRLEDILTSEDVENTNYEHMPKQQSTVNKGVSFADEDDSETLVIVFKHSEVEPSEESYDATLGIIKPSDIYDAYANLFSETRSILKKSKYGTHTKDVGVIKKKVEISKKPVVIPDPEENIPENEPNTIIIKDVVEKYKSIDNKLENKEARPTSLFKKKRLQKKPI